MNGNLSDAALDMLRRSFGDPVVGPFVDQFQRSVADGSLQINTQELHVFFTHIYDAGYRDARPEPTDSGMIDALRKRIEALSGAEA